MGILSDDPADEATRQWVERVSRFRSEMEASLDALQAPLDVSARSSAGDDLRLVHTVRAILEAASLGGQREILRTVLDGSAICFPRRILFIGRDRTLVGWERRGFQDGPGQADEGAAVKVPADGDHLPARARAAGTMLAAGQEGPGDEVMRAIGGGVPAWSAAAPLKARDRVVAVLYGDAFEPASPERAELFDLLARVGGLALEIRASRRRVVAERSGVLLPVPVVDRGGPPARFDANPAEPEEAEMQALLGDLEALPRHDDGEGLSPEEQRQHNDARRFASLLVSELLLYNEEAVIQGRKQRDLSQRLAHEIERTRRTYEARIPSTLRGGPRYLEDELLRVLADGDEGLLTV